MISMGTDHVIIAHGKSEVLLFWGLFTRFDIDANIFSLENGERGIPMSHLPQVLSKRPFIMERMLADRWRGLDYRSGHIPGLGIFPVVDHDGDDRNVLPYITGNLLRDVPLAESVHPVLNHPNLDAVIEGLGLGRLVGRKDEFYQKLANRLRGRETIISFYEKLCDYEHTNMEILLYHVMRRVPAYQDSIEPPRRKDWGFLTE